MMKCKINWHKIPSSTLNCISSSLSCVSPSEPNNNNNNKNNNNNNNNNIYPKPLVLLYV